MKHFIILAAAALLSACGGGEVHCTAAGACVVNVAAAPVDGAASAAAGAASMPSSSASAPSSSASAPANGSTSVPLGTVVQSFPMTAKSGQTLWRAGGMTYTLVIGDVGSIQWVAIYSAPVASGYPQMATVEAMLDTALDLHTPAKDDAALRAYLQTYVVPKADAWMRANSSRWASGMTVDPYYTGSVSDSMTAVQRLAARMPQWLAVSAGGVTLR